MLDGRAAENFTLTRVSSIPEAEKEPVDVLSAASAADFRDALGDGSFGDPHQASDEVMDQMLKAAVEAMVEALREL